MKKIHIKNFGCQMNKLDSSLVANALSAMGFEHTDKVSDADAVLINTCSVRQHAEDRVLSNLGHLKHLKKKHPNLVVAVAGCMAQRLGTELLNHPAVDSVAGPAQLPRLAQMIADALKQNSKKSAVTEKIRQAPNPSVSEKLDEFEFAYDSHANHAPGQAFVRAMRGCNNFCTYCIVPYVRGPEVSRSPHMIIEQIKKLADQGVKQITLLGQTIDSYCYKDGQKTYKLADLLEMVSSIDSIKWIRFITSHPGKFDTAILQAMASLEKVCPYLHIPAQSGSNKILKAMNRRYTREHYIDLIEKAKSIVPDLAVASDFIVGFPGETEDDFAQTADLIRKLRFKNSFIFKYSPRPGTRAEQKLHDDIPLEVKKQRNIVLLELQNKIAEEDNKRFLGKTVKVLVEGPSKKAHLNNADNQNLPQLIARTADDYITVFNGPLSLAGNFANVRITKTSALTLFAELTD